MDNGYWTSILQQRVSRRRALIATSATAAGAAFLAACGGSDSSSDGKGSGSGLVSPTTDTSNVAKAGGSSKWWLGAEPNSFDIRLLQAALVKFKGAIYRSIIQEKPGHLQPQDFKDIEPDLASSWELAPDLSQLTFKLRQGAVWHNKAPINGRPIDVEDWTNSWTNYVKVGSARATYANSLNPAAPVLSVTSTDASTIVVKLKDAPSYIEAQFAHPSTGKFQILPKEIDTTFDIRRDMIGNGPFVMTRYEPSVGMTWSKNPNFYEKGLPYVDKMEVPFITEYATGLAQLKAGNIHTFDVRSEEILQTKRDVPALQIYQKPAFSTFSISNIGFGWLPKGRSPFRDERVRQAVSMSIDRDLWLETFSNASGFQKDGLPVESHWASTLQAGQFGYLDPKSSAFGPTGSFYKHNPAEAKKLLAAAGFTNMPEIASGYGPIFGEREATVLDGMLRDAGFKTTLRVLDANLEYPDIRDSQGQFTGWNYVVGGGTVADDPVAYYSGRYSPAGGLPIYLGFDVNGTGDRSGDPRMEELIGKAGKERDLPKRKVILEDIQRYLGKMQYSVINPGTYSSFNLAWPALRNFGVYQRGTGADEYYHWWIDKSLAPENKN